MEVKEKIYVLYSVDASIQAMPPFSVHLSRAYALEDAIENIKKDHPGQKLGFLSYFSVESLQGTQKVDPVIAPDVTIEEKTEDQLKSMAKLLQDKGYKVTKKI